MVASERLAELRETAQRSAVECAVYGGVAVVAAVTELAEAAYHTNPTVFGIKGLGFFLSTVAAPGGTFFSIRAGLQHADAHREITAILANDPEA